MRLLQLAYDAESFRAQGHQLIDQLASQLRVMQEPGRRKVSDWHSPEEELGFWRERMRSAPTGTADFLGEVIERSICLHHPHYIGHQVGVVAPSAALAGLVAEFLNNGSAVYEMGSVSTALERWLVQQTCQQVGFQKGDGFLTSGGTLAMLSALLAARAGQLGASTFDGGTPNNWSVMASAESHYCVARAVQVMGGGSEGLVKVPVDSCYKMQVALLDELYEQACARGRRPFALVGSACTTSTGAYDDLAAQAEFCRRRGLWFHVDGAHGAAVAFCPELKFKVNGLELADSVILDFHKMMMVPGLTTAVLFRHAPHSWSAFHQQAHYLWDEQQEGDWYNLGKRTFECTKLMMSIKVVALWREYGVQVFAEYLRTVHSLATEFARLIRGRKDFEVAIEPESNIVCFRYLLAATSPATIDEINVKVRRELVEAGEFYLVQTVLNGRTWLRTTLMNPFTTLQVLGVLLDRIAALAQRISEPTRSPNGRSGS